MAKNNNISMAVIRRMPRYYRFLSELNKSGVDRISSTKLAEIMRVTASQVRQDLNCFGGFGQQGYGYSVDFLTKQIGEILGLSNCYSAVLFGAGNLGKAVATHMNFEFMGFDLKAIFDKDSALIGTNLRGLKILPDEDIKSYLKNNKIDVAFLCLPKASVENIISLLYESGIKNFWNFSHYDIVQKYKDTIVENVHMSDSLMTLSYRIAEKNKEIK